MRSIVTIVFFLLFNLSALSQITLEQSAYKQLLDSGYDIYHWVEESDARFDIGTPGATDNVYDLTAFKFKSKPVEVRFIDPAGTPYAEKFLEATHTVQSYWGCEQRNENYHYYQLKQDGYYNLMHFLIVGSHDVYLKYVPPQPEVKFPLTMGSSWKYESDTLTIDSSASIEIQYKNRYEVIAAGTLITPMGKRQCLVLKYVYSWEMFSLDGIDSSRSVAYHLLDAQGLEVVISIDEDDTESSTPRITQMRYTVLPAKNFEEI